MRTLKRIRLWLVLLSLLGAGCAVMAQTPALAGPPSDYTRAVQAYVDAATAQIAAIRAQVDAEVGSPPDDAAKKRLAPVYAKLDACDHLLEDLKKATPATFDKVKGRFEEARAAMVKRLEAAHRR